MVRGDMCRNQAPRRVIALILRGRSAPVRLLVIHRDASLAMIHNASMQLLQIDYTPAIVMLCVGCVLAIGFLWLEARAERNAAEQAAKLFAELEAANNSTQE